MKSTGGENVLSMQPRNFPAVVTMPSRNRARSSAVVVTMPSHNEHNSKVITLPARNEQKTSEADAQPESKPELSIFRSGYGALSLGVRMTLVALFALLGRPHPTRDNDPGPSAARPCRWELTSLVSRLRLPSSERKAAAAAAAEHLGVDEEFFARAA